MKRHGMMIPEYQRRVFNEAMLTCMEKMHAQILNGGSGECCGFEDKADMKMAAKMCREFFKDELKLDESTIRMTMKRLSESVTFIRDCADVSNTIAESKAKCAAEEGCEMDQDQKIELSDEDQELIDKLFDEKSPDLQVDQIRDATVKALVAEDQKAQELKRSMDIANSQVAAGEDPAVMEETVRRLDQRGPTSLMNAIINRVTTAAIHDVSESATGKDFSIGNVMKENADIIKSRAVMLYTLYEMANVCGIVHWTPAQVKRISEEIYYGK